MCVNFRRTSAADEWFFSGGHRIQADPFIIPNLTLDTRAILELPASFFSSSFKPSITNPTHNVSCCFGDLLLAKQLH
jgi:hypothetical protein